MSTINGNFNKQFQGTTDFINGEQGRKSEIFTGSGEHLSLLGDPPEEKKLHVAGVSQDCYMVHFQEAES